MNQQPPDEYGWLTARTPEEIEALGSPKKGDESWHESWTPVHEDYYKRVVSYDCILPVRRPIDPNRGQPPGSQTYEMVPETATKSQFEASWSFTMDGATWISANGMRALPMGHLSVRRRKRVVEQESFDLSEAQKSIATALKPAAPTPSQLDEAAKVLFDCGQFEGQWQVIQQACRRHLAVVKELRDEIAGFEVGYVTYQERIKHLQNQVQCFEEMDKIERPFKLPQWHPISPDNLPKAGQGFSFYIAPCYVDSNIGEENPKEWFESNPSVTHWTPLPPLPPQKSEAERLLAEFDNLYQNEGRSFENCVKFILARKETKP